jgi:hypothetical protein
VGHEDAGVTSELLDIAIEAVGIASEMIRTAR